MKSLFSKIFLWFWMAFVIVGVTLAAVVAITRSNETMLAKVSLYLPLEARKAADIYEREGKTGLKHHFDHIVEVGSAKPYLLDEDWKDVLDRHPSARAVAFAKAAREDAPLISKFTGWNGLVAQQAIGARGQRYTMLVVFSASPLLVSSGALALRRCSACLRSRWSADFSAIGSPAISPIQSCNSAKQRAELPTVRLMRAAIQTSGFDVMRLGAWV